MQTFDAIVIGAGAAGLHCAGMAGQRGLRVLTIDHSPRIAEKIRISGGGRCNFTNTGTTPANFLSANPPYCRSALARYSPADFVALLRRHGVAFHEKHRGQLFCDDSADAIIRLLLAECDTGRVTRWQPCAVKEVARGAGGFELVTDHGTVCAPQLVVACGGLSIPQIGASDFGLRLARQFGHRIVETRPALVPLTFSAADWAPFAGLAGLSLQASVCTTDSTGGKRSKQPRSAFAEDLLFTHRGLSGPAILQISSYWQPGQAIDIDLAHGRDLQAELLQAKRLSRRKLSNELAESLPRRLADTWLANRHPHLPDKAMPELRDADVTSLASGLRHWQLEPDGTEGYRKAEVMAGGVDTRQLQSTTMASQHVPGLHFIGEVVDVTGWLGGYNFQWAWASAAACANALQRAPLTRVAAPDLAAI